jgi:hypothetical protein
MTTQTYPHLIDARQFATMHGVHERTVQRWATDGELPGATKGPDKRWYIPADAMRITPLPGTTPADMSPTRRDVAVVADTSPTRRDVGGDTLADALAVLPAFLTLEQASRLLGVPPVRIKENPERFGAEPVDERRQLMVPARIVREIAGLQ